MSRNPLKSGQCFLRKRYRRLKKEITPSQSPQIGSMFLTSTEWGNIWLSDNGVAIPSNRVNVSYHRLNLIKVKDI